MRSPLSHTERSGRIRHFSAQACPRTRGNPCEDHVRPELCDFDSECDTGCGRSRWATRRASFLVYSEGPIDRPLLSITRSHCVDGGIGSEAAHEKIAAGGERISPCPTNHLGRAPSRHRRVSRNPRVANGSARVSKTRSTPPSGPSRSKTSVPLKTTGQAPEPISPTCKRGWPERMTLAPRQRQIHRPPLPEQVGPRHEGSTNVIKQFARHD